MGNSAIQSVVSNVASDLSLSGQAAEDFPIFDGTNWLAKGGSEKIKVGRFTRDLSAVTGTAAVTGVGFKPSGILFFGVVDGLTLASFTMGIADASGVSGEGETIGVSTTAGVWNGSNIDRVAQIHPVDGSNSQNATLSSLDSDGFTLSWTKVGTPTGTFVMKFLAFR